jgi:hypothetical protein
VGQGGTRCPQRVAKSDAASPPIWIFERLSANENQDARYQRKNSRHYPGNTNVKERGDSDKNQVNREQEHSNVFGDHGLLLMA